MSEGQLNTRTISQQPEFAQLENEDWVSVEKGGVMGKARAQSLRNGGPGRVVYAQDYPFNAKGDDEFDNSVAIENAIDYLLNTPEGGGVIELGAGRFKFNGIYGPDGYRNGIVIPYQSANATENRIQIRGQGASTLLKAANADMHMIRVSDSHCIVENLTIEGSDLDNVHGLSVIPEDLTQTTQIVNQLHNKFKDLYIKNCEEGVYFRTGPKVGAVQSGCWLNSFWGVRIIFTKRGVLFGDCPVGGSGSNRNAFYDLRVGQGCNTGIEIRDADTNIFYGYRAEGITSLDGPSEVPTGIIVRATGTSGLDNNYNKWIGGDAETATRPVENYSPTAWYDLDLGATDAACFPVEPAYVRTSDASLAPQISLDWFYQAGGQFAEYQDGRSYNKSQYGLAVEPEANYGFKNNENSGMRLTDDGAVEISSNNIGAMQWGEGMSRAVPKTAPTGPGGSPTPLGFKQPYLPGGKYLISRGGFSASGVTYGHRTSVFVETSSGVFVENGTRTEDMVGDGAVFTGDAVARAGDNIVVTPHISKAATVFTNYVSIVKLN